MQQYCPKPEISHYAPQTNWIVHTNLDFIGDFMTVFSIVVLVLPSNNPCCPLLPFFWYIPTIHWTKTKAGWVVVNSGLVYTDTALNKILRFITKHYVSFSFKIVARLHAPLWIVFSKRYVFMFILIVSEQKWNMKRNTVVVFKLKRAHVNGPGRHIYGTSQWHHNLR